MGYRKYYRNDPFKMVAKFDSKCSCGVQIKRGDEIVYYPKNHKAECINCGRRSLEAIEDEDIFENRCL